MDNLEAVDSPSTDYAVRTARWTVTKVNSINAFRNQLDQFVQQLVAQDGFQCVNGNHRQLQEFNSYWREECQPSGLDGWPTGEQFQKV